MIDLIPEDIDDETTVVVRWTVEARGPVKHMRRQLEQRCLPEGTKTNYGFPSITVGPRTIEVLEQTARPGLLRGRPRLLTDDVLAGALVDGPITITKLARKLGVDRRVVIQAALHCPARVRRDKQTLHLAGVVEDVTP